MKKLTIFLTLFLIISYYAYSQDHIKKIGLVWDTSYGMVDRNLEAEIGFLDDYFAEHQSLEVQLVIFSNTKLVDELYQVTNGQWDDVSKELEGSIADGATSFQNIFPDDVDEILLFTDGKSAYGELPSSLSLPTTIIYSVVGGNLSTLKLLAENSGGRFINLLEGGTNNIAKIEQDLITVTGRVTSSGVPLDGALVQSRELGKTTTTSADGSYSIEGNKNGTLKFSHFGKKTYIARVPLDGKKDIDMKDGTETLDEILITADKRPEEKVVRLGMEERSESSIGFAVETIDQTAISDQDIDLETAVTGQFSNVHIKSDQDISQFLSRGRNMSILLDQTGLLVVDGVPMPSDPQFLGGVAGDRSLISKSGLLTPDNIAEISVLKGLAATNKWGTHGRNGVILVTTKTGSSKLSNNTDSAEIDLGTTDTYKGGALIMSELPNTDYIEALKNARNVDEAYSIYLQQREYFGDDPSFFFNTATFFKKFENNFVLEKILSSVSEFPDLDHESKMALAYKLEEMGLFKAAIPVLKNLIKEHPRKVQHYRNLALTYKMAGQYNDALDLYKMLDRKQIKGISSYDNLEGTIENEYRNLLGLHGDNMKLSGINPKMLTNLKLDTRVVIEWNNFDAEFDLQIVNPQNRYYTWSHTKKAEASRFNRESELGYGLEEYFMTVDDKGIWLFNLTYFGDLDKKNDVPLYLKITKYDNFGSINQSRHTKVISIDELDKTQTLMTIKI